VNNLFIRALTMKITFFRPNLSDLRSSDAMTPLVFAILAARTPPDVEVVLFDERLEAIPYDDPTDLVASDRGNLQQQLFPCSVRSGVGLSVLCGLVRLTSETP
jgi:hypothetical protein